MVIRLGFVLSCVVVGCNALQAADTLRLVVKVDPAGVRISPTMYGVFFEDINFGADGGLYAELVKNRSFEFPDGLTGWTEQKPGSSQGSLAILDQQPLHPAQPHYLRIAAAAGAGYGVENEGFCGMGVHQGQEYLCSADIRSADARPTALRS